MHTRCSDVQRRQRRAAHCMHWELRARVCGLSDEHAAAKLARSEQQAAWGAGGDVGGAGEGGEGHGRGGRRPPPLLYLENLFASGK